MLRLATLGGLSLYRAADDAAVGGPRRKPLALLALVAAAGDAGLARDRAVALLWPDESLERGRRALAQTVYALRRETGLADVVTGDGTLVVPAERVATDHAALIAAAARGDAAAVAAGYGGPFLDGVHFRGCVEFERWVETERARLARLHRDALGTLADAATRAGTPADARPWLERAFAADPLDAQVAARLVRVIARSGDRTEALRVAAAHERLLRADLDAHPDEEWRTLVEQVRAGALEVVAHAPGAPGALPVMPRAASPADGEPPSAAVLAAPVVAASMATVPTSLPAALPPTAVPSTPTGPVEHPVWRAGRRARWGLLVAGVAIVGLAATWQRNRSTAPTATEAPRVVAVAPFELAAAPGADVLLDGFPHLVATSLDAGLVGEDGRPVQVRRVHAPVRGVIGGADPALLGAVREAGAAEVVTGSVVQTAAGRLVASAVLRSASDGRELARAEWEGAPAALATGARRVAAQLLLGRRDEPREHVGALVHLPLPVLRAYLAGHALLRTGRYPAAVDSFGVVLRHDSTVALAALGLAAAADWVRDDVPTGRILARAWAGRAALPPADRVHLDALAGRRFPATTPWVERIADWERAVALAPERPELWFGLGDALLHVGLLTGAPDALTRARDALARALARDSLYRPALVHLGQLAARAGDHALLARLARRARAAVASDTDVAGGAVAAFLEWRHAAGGPSARSIPLPDAALTWAALVAVHDAAAPADVAARLRSALGHPASPLDAAAFGEGSRDDAVPEARRTHLRHAAHALALVRGRPREAAAFVLDGVRPGDGTARLDALRTLVLDALAGESPLGASHARALDATLAAAPRVAPAEREFAECVLGLWHADAGQRAAAQQRLERVPPRRVREDQAPGEAERAVAPCRLLLTATLAPRSAPLTDRPPAVRDSLDALLDRGDEPGRLWPYLTLAVARLHLVDGDSAGALARLRRPPLSWQWPHYRAAELRLEGALARARGDLVGAWCATRHLVALRDGAESTAEPRGLRTALAAIEPTGRAAAARARLAPDAVPIGATACRAALVG